MESTSLIFVGGFLGLFSLIIADILLYRKNKQSRVQLIAKINQAEKELQEDILQIDISEYGKTKSGRELLNLLHSSTVKPTKESIVTNWLRVLMAKIQWQNLFDFDGGRLTGAFIVIMVVGMILGVVLSGGDFLNPQVSAAEAQQMNVQIKYQREILELELQRQQAETEAQIREIQMQQEYLQIELEAQHAENLARLQAQEKYSNILNIFISVVSVCLLISVALLVYVNLKMKSPTPVISEQSSESGNNN